MAFATAIMAATPWLTTALTVGGGAVSAVGSIREGNAAARAETYNAAILDRDAYVADQNRKVALQHSALDEADKRRENTRVLSSIRAGYGRSGIEMAGSPLDVLTDSAMELELDAQRIGQEGDARAREFGAQATGMRESANLRRQSASGRKTAGYFGAASAFLGTAGTALQRSA